MRHGATSALTVLVAAGALAMPVGLTLTSRAAPAPRTLAGASVPAPSAQAAQASAAQARSPRCGPEPHDAAGWSRLFGALTGDWSGGDGTSSLRLPDGRLLWLFGDTVTGDADGAGHRRGAVSLVHNSVLLTSGDCVTSVTSVASHAEALPGSDGTWLWPTHAVVVRRGAPGRSSTVTVFAQRVARTGDGPFDFRRVATSVVRLRIGWGGDVRVGPAHDVADADVLWGAAVAPRGATTWVFGTRAASGTFGRDLLLARAPTATVDVRSTWSYRTAGGWSADPAAAVAVRRGQAGVSTVLSAAGLGGRFVLVTKPQEFLDNRVVLLTSRHPWGPWTQRTLLRAASTEDEPQYSPGLVAGSRLGHAVVVVNRTSTSLQRLLTDSTTARPTFYDVDLAD